MPKPCRTWYHFRYLIEQGKSDEEIISIVADEWGNTKWKVSQMLEAYYKNKESER
jgi:hypothetical protein